LVFLNESQCISFKLISLLFSRNLISQNLRVSRNSFSISKVEINTNRVCYVELIINLDKQMSVSIVDGFFSVWKNVSVSKNGSMQHQHKTINMIMLMIMINLPNRVTSHFLYFKFLNSSLVKLRLGPLHFEITRFNYIIKRD
jgi:hypothetical protein